MAETNRQKNLKKMLEHIVLDSMDITSHECDKQTVCTECPFETFCTARAQLTWQINLLLEDR